MKKAHFSVLKIVRYHFFTISWTNWVGKKYQVHWPTNFFFFAAKISKKFKILSSRFPTSNIHLIKFVKFNLKYTKGENPLIHLYQIT